MAYILTYDIGTTGCKTCLFRVDETVKLLASEGYDYPLYILEDGGAEQDGDDWWKAMCISTGMLMNKVDVTPEDIDGISFCSQMQGLALVDRNGVPVHRPMSYMDQRAKKEIREGIAYGPQIAGANIFKLLPSLAITGAVSGSVKDPLWKYKWIEAHEPENFARAAYWLDVKEYLLARCTGEFVMTRDSAFATLIYDTRPGKEGWSEKLCKMFGVNRTHLPRVIKSSDRAGLLSAQAAAQLGLKEGTPVFGGGGDTTAITVGSGAAGLGRTHIYWGTSGWVITVTDKQTVDPDAMIAAIVGAESGRFNYFAEMETAGKSVEWILRIPAHTEDLYANVEEILTSTEPGAGGVIFTPWLHGNRCPFEDPDAMGVFFNLKLETGKNEMIRAVVEGVSYHLRWMLECQERKVKASDPIRFVGGGSLSHGVCQILADILGRPVETVESPKNVGAVGAAVIAAVGLGLIYGYDQAEKIVPADALYQPREANRSVYEKQYGIFKKLYKSNKALFKEINN